MPCWPRTGGHRVIASLIRITALVTIIISLLVLFGLMNATPADLGATSVADAQQASAGMSFWAGVAISTSLALLIGLDAAKLGARRGRLGRSFTDLGPFAWFFAATALPILGIPAYLFTRPHLRSVWIAEQTSEPPPGSFTSVPHVRPPAVDPFHAAELVTSSPYETGMGAGPGPILRFCTRCGHPREPVDVFCAGCGQAHHVTIPS